MVIGIGAAACGAGDRATDVAWQAITGTVGDTIVVRTVSGSVWGEPAELVEEVRIGVFEGEEEYILGDVTGFAVAPDGSVILRDPATRACSAIPPTAIHSAAGRYRAGGSPPGVCSPAPPVVS